MGRRGVEAGGMMSSMLVFEKSLVTSKENSSFSVGRSGSSHGMEMQLWSSCL